MRYAWYSSSGIAADPGALRGGRARHGGRRARLCDPGMNLRTTFEKIDERAAVKAWPRLFHTCAPRAPEIGWERFRAHVVAGWLGHSPLIAAKHYLQTRDAHFDAAAGIGKPAPSPAT